MFDFIRNNFEVKGKTGVVSGASQGLGLALAKQLYAKGASIIIISRSEDKLKRAKKEIEDAKDVTVPNQFVRYLSADLRDYQATSAVIPLLDELKIKKLDFLFCCAGSAHPKYFLNMTHEDLDFGLETNFNTCVNLVQVLAKRMIDESAVQKCQKDSGFIDDMMVTSKKQSGNSHIVLISSEVAFYNFIGYAEYGPAKAAIKAFGDSIRHELKPYNVTVHVVFPGNFDSEGYAIENKSKPEACKTIEGPSKPISSEECAKKIIHHMEQGQLYIHTDFIGWVLNSFSLGFNPHTIGIFQIIPALIGSVIGGTVDYIHQILIQGYFRKEGGFIETKKTK